MKYVFVYRLTHDTGFAPCVNEGTLSLACCKGGYIKNGQAFPREVRYWIGTKKYKDQIIDYTKDDVYILGLYHGKFLYIAKVTDVQLMTDYFAGIGKTRTDGIYSNVNGELIRNDHLSEENVHTDDAQIMRDLAGKYVLLSSEFVYLGRDAVQIDYISENCPLQRSSKPYSGEIAEKLVAECRKYADGQVHEPNESIKAKCAKCGSRKPKCSSNKPKKC